MVITTKIEIALADIVFSELTTKRLLESPLVASLPASSNVQTRLAVTLRQVMNSICQLSLVGLLNANSYCLTK